MSTKKITALLLGSVVLVAAVFAGTSLASPSKKGAAGSTCLVTDVGGLNDRSFNQSAYQGLKNAQKDLGIEGRVVTSSSGSDYVPNLLSCVKGGADLTIGVGFLMADAVAQVAQQFVQLVGSRSRLFAHFSP